MAGIAQTLIVVRIAYGQAVESVQQMISTLQFIEGGNSNSQDCLTVTHGTAELRPSLAEVGEPGTVGGFEMNESSSNAARDVV
ncbi:hypothetical protein PQX77_019827 [Marasmius sp. AFHP31]|nr:hypothetical protein PQX77_019827 [Marasmius sp. AFHP31]